MDTLGERNTKAFERIASAFGRIASATERIAEAVEMGAISPDVEEPPPSPPRLPYFAAEE